MQPVQGEQTFLRRFWMKGKVCRLAIEERTAASSNAISSP